MADPLIDIPDKPAFKAAEVCDIAHIPAYVLRSWEKEFPNLGIVARPGGPRVYRRADVEQILRIKQLVFSEGLTLAGARRRLEGEPPAEPEPEFPLPEDVKVRVGKVKEELRSLLDLLTDRLSPAATWPPGPPTVVEDVLPATLPIDPEPPATDEPALPLLDAEAETSSPPPAASVPAGGRKRKPRRG